MYRNKSLDTIRGIAIFLVIIAHYFSNTIKYDGITKILGDYNINIGIIGRMGVMLFFFLSGFLIYQSLQNTASVVKFYKKRFFRIYPPYIFSLVFYIFLTYFIFNFLPKYDIKTYLVNALMLQDIFGVKLAVSVYWSLLIEIKFYIIIGIIYYYFISKNNNILDYLFFIILFINIIIYLKRGYGSWFLTWLPFFWVGIYLYLYVKRIISLNKFVILSFLVFIYCYILKEFNLAFFLILNILIFLIIYKLNFSNKILNFYGQISYSFYLIHTIISYPLLYLITKNLTKEYLLFKILIVFLISTLISYLSFRYIENFYFTIRNKI